MSASRWRLTLTRNRGYAYFWLMLFPGPCRSIERRNEMGPRSESTRLHHRRACLHDLGRAAANLLLKPDEADDGETHTAGPIQYQRNYALCAGDDPCNRQFGERFTS
jgi:hypothetical protein